MMNARQTGWRQNARILWAITAKDLFEALRNKNTIILIVFGLLMVIFYAKYPALMVQGEPPNILIHDEGRSALVAYLENSPALAVYTYPSLEVMQEKLAHGDVPELGLVIPASFDQAVESGGAPTLRGYMMSWVTAEQASGLQASVAAEVSRLVRSPVTIEMEERPVYPSPDSGGLGVTAGFAFVYIIVTLGMIMIPYLMLEEKQAHTLDALLVSPASEGQVVTAKALTGLLYCLVGAGLGLAVFHTLVAHWWLAILAVVCGALFTVAMGLLLGTLIENRGQLSLLAWMFIIPLFLPVFLSLMDDLVPAWLIQVFRTIPTTVLFNLLRESFAGSFSVGTALIQMAWILACAGAGLLGVTWLVRRHDREPEKGPARFAPARAAAALREGLRGLSRPQARRQSQTLDRSTPHAEQPPREFNSPAGLRAITAIAVKDIGMAFQSKLVLSIILGTLMVIFNSSVLPALLWLGNKPTAVVYDEGRSIILRGLAAREDLRLGIVESRSEMEAAISGAPETRLGLVIPADFDQRAGSSQPISLEGYLAHWADPEKAARWTQVFAEELGQVSWSEVRINTAGHVLYPTVETGGQLSLTTLMMVIVILTIGMALVPLLLIEEKESRTFDVLLVSPASLWQVLAGKALAGSFYVLVAALVVLLLNWSLMLHWEVALLAVLLGAAFAVALGLVVGLISDTPATNGVWGGILLVILIGLTGLNALAGEDWPLAVRSLLERLPGAALIELFKLAMVGEVPPGMVWANAGALLLAAGLVYAVVLGLLRRADR